jgi:hypothetical protein
LTALGWYPDPENRHEVRFYDGARWTHHVADNGVRTVDDIEVVIDVRGDAGPEDNGDGWRSLALWEEATAASPADEVSTNGNGHHATNGHGARGGWHPDPSGRHELRYHDGQGWTEYVRASDGYRVDPV